jgi:hypothetical protein
MLYPGQQGEKEVSNNFSFKLDAIGTLKKVTKHSFCWRGKA